MTEMRRCPFCGGNAHIRHKIRYKASEPSKTVTIGEMQPVYGGVWDERDYDVLDWSFGFQVYCGRCHVKTLYRWGPWHSYDDWELDGIGLDGLRTHEPGESDECAKQKAASLWNMRADEE